MDVNDILELGTEIAEGELITESTSVYNADIISRLDTIIEGEQAIHNCLWIIIAFLAVGTVIKFLWTFLSKWLFGGV